MDPAGLRAVGGHQGQLVLGAFQQVPGAGTYLIERRGGLGVSAALAQAVGVVVVWPAVEVGVQVGVDVPGVEDPLGLADVPVEATLELTLGVGVGGNERGAFR